MSPWRSEPQPALGSTARRAVIGLVLGFGLAGLSRPACAQAADERQRIAAERGQVEIAFNAAQAACQGRFLLTQCIDQAREERRLAMASLKRRELDIDDQARRERTAQRLLALAQRASAAEAASRPALGPAAGPASGPTDALAAEPDRALAPGRHSARQRASAASASASPPAPASSPAAARSAKVQPAAGAAAAAAQRARRSLANYQRRQTEAAAHRAAVFERNRRQDALRPPAAGLPVPAAPAAPASRTAPPAAAP